MIYVDNIIRTFLVNGDVRETEQTAIFGGDESCITNIGYDLRTNAFYADGQKLDAYQLEPGDSVIAESMEIIHFDRDTCGMVNIKNSRLRIPYEKAEAAMTLSNLFTRCVKREYITTPNHTDYAYDLVNGSNAFHLVSELAQTVELNGHSEVYESDLRLHAGEYRPVPGF